MSKKIKDIRKTDVVRFRKDLNAEQIDRLLKFVNNLDGGPTRNYVAAQLDNINSKHPPLFEIISNHETQKNKTSYVRLKSINSFIYLHVQSRYLVLIQRVAAHPLTKIFL